MLSFNVVNTLFLNYSAKIRRIIDTAKYIQLKNVNRIDLFFIIIYCVKEMMFEMKDDARRDLISLRLKPGGRWI